MRIIANSLSTTIQTSGNMIERLKMILEFYRNYALTFYINVIVNMQNEKQKTQESG